MPQGRKKPAGPVSINQLSGTYKKGGAVMMASGGALTQKDLDRMEMGRGQATQMAQQMAQKDAARKAAEQRMASQRAAAEQKAAAAKAAAEQRMASQRAASTSVSVQQAQRMASQRAASTSVSLQQAEQRMASQRAASTAVSLKQAEKEKAAAKPKIEGLDPKTGRFAPGSMEYNSNSPVNRPTVSVSQPATRVFTPPTPQVPKREIAGLDPKTGRFAPGSMEYNSNSPVNRPTVSGTGSVGMRRGGKVQHNGKKRGGAVC
jgi:multidrug efflux pump subunit AcrA (membrane-fusion protein)